MAGRPSRQAHAAKAARAIEPAPAGISASTAERANRFLEREDLLDQAIHGGVINAGMRAHYQRAFDADPGGTRAFLASIGLRAEAASAASEPDEYLNTLTDNEQRRIAAARDGRPTSRFVNGG
jgi:hypothetical protein